MSVYAIISSEGKIGNRIILDDPAAWEPPSGCTVVVEPDGATFDIGGTYLNGQYSPPPASPAPAVPVPASISARQFFQQLAVQGIISKDEALAAVKTGTIPAALQTLINGLPADQQFGTTMIVSGATTFERNHPLTIAIGSAYGWTSDQMDALFCAAAVL